MSNQLPPIPAELTSQLENLTPQQKAFLAGYLWARSQGAAMPAGAAIAPVAAAAAIPAKKITVISASQTGNAAGIAKKLTEQLTNAALDAKLVSAGSYKAKQLTKEEIVLLVTSTQGEGEPPEEGVPLHNFLFGKKSPKLDNLAFAVFGLGDTSYPKFSQAGVDFDTKMGELGGERLLDRVDADVDYQSLADEWIEKAVAKLKDYAGGAAAAVAPVTAGATEVAESQYNKENPYTASLLKSHLLVTDDADKQVVHVEIDLDESGLQYKAGDALGVVTKNDPAAVDAILAALTLTGDESVTSKSGTTTLREALLAQVDLNQLTPKFIKGYAASSDDEKLKALVEDKAALQAFQASTPLLGLLSTYPQTIDAQTLIDGLKPLTPRLYSIASSQEEVGEEVHLCVGVVDIPHDDKTLYGSASGLMSNRLEEGDEVQVFVEPNPRFRLPANAETPTIMIGAGTGIAPFRSFMQQRRADEATGKNWLIFGNRHYRRDFLYAAEWVEFRDQGLLNESSLAWSRDSEDKVYVQDMVSNNAKTFWQWLQDGAHIYICGDASRMAKDVEKAILGVIASQGNKDEEAAIDYLNDLREADRYQRDVY